MAVNKTLQRSVVIRENRRRYELQNNGGWEISKVIIEGCIANAHGDKGCEAILIAEKAGELSLGFFIELKGNSVRHALKQLQSSLNLTKTDLIGIRLFGRIIPSKYKRTKFLETIEKSLYSQFKTLGGNLIIKENYSDTI